MPSDLQAAKARPSPIHFPFLDSSGLARKPFPARRDGVQLLLLVRQPVVPELALRARLDIVAIDQFRVIVRP